MRAGAGGSIQRTLRVIALVLIGCGSASQLIPLPIATGEWLGMAKRNGSDSARSDKGTIARHNPVFIISAAIALALALWGVFGSASFSALATAAMTALKSNFSWLYLWAELFFVLFVLVLAFSPLGKIRLGADDEKPTIKTLPWFAMLFAAGMGIGLVFWSIAEPLSHYVAPMAGIEPLSDESQRFAFRSCFMHWGLDPWASYAVVGLGLGYFAFRKHKILTVSSTLHPVLKKQTYKWPGVAIDVFACVLTVIGIAASFGMGCLQISGGLTALWGLPSNSLVWALIIVVVAVIYLWASAAGIKRGMSLLSNINLVLCVALLVLGFAVGPHLDTVKSFFIGMGDYLVNFFPDSVRLSSNGDSTWIRDWRVYYWAWWLSWAPFVGVFIARISRGRTVREFVLGVMIAPTVMCAVWFAVTGSLGIHAASNFSLEQLTAIIASPETAPYVVFSQYPLGTVLSIIAMLLLFLFFITSATSAVEVLSLLTSSGSTHPSTKKKMFWGVMMAVMSYALVLSGGISGIQTVSVVIAFPFVFIMLVMCWSLVKAMRQDAREEAEGKQVLNGDYYYEIPEAEGRLGGKVVVPRRHLGNVPSAPGGSGDPFPTAGAWASVVPEEYVPALFGVVHVPSVSAEKYRVEGSPKGGADKEG